MYRRKPPYAVTIVAMPVVFGGAGIRAETIDIRNRDSMATDLPKWQSADPLHTRIFPTRLTHTAAVLGKRVFD